LEALGQFKPRFLMLGADSPEGELLRGALKAMAYNMEAMQLTDTTLAKSKRLFGGNADLLPDCVRTWQRLRDAPEPVPPQAAAAAATTPKFTKVELELAAAVSSGSTPPVQQGALGPLRYWGAVAPTCSKFMPVYSVLLKIETCSICCCFFRLSCFLGQSTADTPTTPVSCMRRTF